MSRSLTAIRHVSFEGLGSFETLLRNADFTISYVDAATEDLREIEAGADDLLVVLGGPIGAYQERAYPFLRDEITLLEQRLAARLPTLGICLGSQLIARALGARVQRGPSMEIGWSGLTLTQAGRASSVEHFSGEHTPVLHWHGDTFELPNGATLLASDDVYENQAFTWGDCALGVQFHPEVTARELEAWYVGNVAELAAVGVSVESLRLESEQYAPVLQSYAELFLHAWLRSVGL
jgi:GMP synthase (glutamine-hydrolysing)